MKEKRASKKLEKEFHVFTKHHNGGDSQIAAEEKVSQLNPDTLKQPEAQESFGKENSHIVDQKPA